MAMAMAAAAFPSTVLSASFFTRRTGIMLFSLSKNAAHFTLTVASAKSSPPSTSFKIKFGTGKTGANPQTTINEEAQSTKPQGIVVPWLVEDAQGNFSFQTTHPNYNGHDNGDSHSMDLPSHSTTQRKKSPKAKASKITAEPKYSKAAKITSEPKYSKASRRFYNENFRAPQRLGKVLATAGVASRRGSEEIIFEGRVAVNGAICKTPQTLVDPLKDAIYIDGKTLPKKQQKKFYFALNKPKGYICSSGEEKKSVLSLLEKYMKIWVQRNPGVPKPRLFTVGRLDVATSGLIIITNDGEFAQKVAHPSSGLRKEYVASVEGKVNMRHLQAISKGTLVEGVHCAPVSVELIPLGNEKRQRVRIVVSEGRKHEVRHLIENAGLKILHKRLK